MAEARAGDNQPKVLVEFGAEEISWLADRLNELRAGWNAALLFKAQGIQDRGEASEKERAMILALEEHKKMETRLRNRLIDKAHDQGFGHL